MSILSRLIDLINTDDPKKVNGKESSSSFSKFAFIDIEVDPSKKTILDIGAVRYDGAIFHKNSKQELLDFIENTDYICGHNIIHHDIKYLFSDKKHRQILVDTLYISPLLFPERPYHKLLKDDKLVSDHINNPVNDCEKAKDLLMDEIDRWHTLPEEKRLIYASLLKDKKEFSGFLNIVNAQYINNIADLIRKIYSETICEHANYNNFINHYPCELAYALALIDTSDRTSITPGWVLHNFPNVEYVITQLRQTHCKEGCLYCNKHLKVLPNLKSHFGFDQFRTYDGEPLQERAAQAAVDGKSLLAIFPTGGGKSLTFQLPALMANDTVHGLTVVISPLQSLMKDQVDNLAERGITDAVTINGLLDPISRADSIKRVLEGEASLLYIAPEMLRSHTIQRILMARHVVRFVIDEAHCFSAWGHDFRVDYFYIGKFIRKYQEQKQYAQPIPVSCFTATAKQKVIQDICDYFKQTLNIDFELFASQATRTNLRYSVIHADDVNDKYVKLRNLVAESDCPTIVYVSRTKRTKELADKLTCDGFTALPFNGKMEADEKIANQEAFMTDQVRIIVATSAFGMGVDKKDVGLVIHYDISNSLENYVQEAGRAGRDPELKAKCFVLYSDDDLDKHFILNNQTKLSISEIQQVWQAIKNQSKQRTKFSLSALEIARFAGWDDSVSDIETRVKTALAALEESGFIERGNNMPQVYATGITVKNLEEARNRISSSKLFEQTEIEQAVRIIKSLISQKYIAKAQNAEAIAESRIDYLADILGLNRFEVVSVVERMRQEGILADSKDISAYLLDAGDSEHKSKILLERYAKLEKFIIDNISDESINISYKQLNDNAISSGIKSAKEKDVRTLLYFLSIKGYTRKKAVSNQHIEIKRIHDRENTVNRHEKRLEICRFAIEWLYKTVTNSQNDKSSKNSVQFSVIELLKDIQSSPHTLFSTLADIQLEDVEEALLYLSKIGALKLEGGFLVLYNAMTIERLKDMKVKYKKEDYRVLDEFYQQKIQQVHIVGEFANLMVKDYDAALQFVQDYFHMDYKKFISKHFKGDKAREIQRNVTQKQYDKLYAQLSERQTEIISDKESRCIVVAAGPGSGKTRVLVHKLGSLLQLEDVKHEQLLMLTFSRAAATEFKQRLLDLIGNAANFVEITTFHSYCFDLLGRIGNLDEVENVVAYAAKMITQGEVEPNKIGKTVLVIDEAQDMGEAEYSLVKALMINNEDMRIIAVGDDDQNIYGFRGSDSKYMFQLTRESGSRLIEMTENYRSSRHIVRCANEFAKNINQRIKHTSITSKRDENGWVGITRHISHNMYQPIIDEIIKNHNSGTTCVLTQTNEEAVIMTALLKKYGINSKLIQSMDSFHFNSIAEVRYFQKCLNEREITPLISDETWEMTKQKTFSKYNDSQSITYLERCIELFEATNKKKYYSDFRNFVFESSIEDFCDTSGADVVVSTIHKAKGREFDNVYMFITDGFKRTDEQMRKYYVGITRAKNSLSIHTNGNLFDNLSADHHTIDRNEYAIPDEVALQLSHKDVYLNFFEPIKNEVLSLKGGDLLYYNNDILYNSKNNKAVLKFSTAMMEKLKEWYERGYHIQSASVRFVVAWKPKDSHKNTPESAILLPDLILSR